MKTCSRCGEQKPLDDFYKTSRANGYTSRCRPCHGFSDRTCRVCGKIFEGRRSQVLCSTGCRKIYRPQTFRVCPVCGKRFGPVDHLSRKFCTYDCKAEAQRTGITRKWVRTKEAGRANRRIAYAVEKGKMSKPTVCEDCGSTERKIEAAHYDYGDPLNVRWLCKSCHCKWDHDEPKGGAVGFSI